MNVEEARDFADGKKAFVYIRYWSASGTCSNNIMYFFIFKNVVYFLYEYN